MKKTKLSNSPDRLNVYLDKGKQKAGMRAIKNRKRQEKKLINLAKFAEETK